MPRRPAGPGSRARAGHLLAHAPDLVAGRLAGVLQRVRAQRRGRRRRPLRAPHRVHEVAGRQRHERAPRCGQLVVQRERIVHLFARQLIWKQVVCLGATNKGDALLDERNAWRQPVANHLHLRGRAAPRACGDAGLCLASSKGLPLGTHGKVLAMAWTMGESAQCERRGRCRHGRPRARRRPASLGCPGSRASRRA